MEVLVLSAGGGVTPPSTSMISSCCRYPCCGAGELARLTGSEAVVVGCREGELQESEKKRAHTHTQQKQWIQLQVSHNENCENAEK